MYKYIYLFICFYWFIFTILQTLFIIINKNNVTMKKM